MNDSVKIPSKTIELLQVTNRFVQDMDAASRIETLTGILCLVFCTLFACERFKRLSEVSWRTKNKVQSTKHKALHNGTHPQFNLLNSC